MDLWSDQQEQQQLHESLVNRLRMEAGKKPGICIFKLVISN